MGQAARHTIMAKFRAAPNGRAGPTKRALVVYDALTRSLTDLNSVVPLVINYDLPRGLFPVPSLIASPVADPLVLAAVEDYVHRLALSNRPFSLSLHSLWLFFSISCASTSGYGRPGVAINLVTPGTDVEMLRSSELAFTRFHTRGH